MLVVLVGGVEPSCDVSNDDLVGFVLLRFYLRGSGSRLNRRLSGLNWLLGNYRIRHLAVGDSSVWLVQRVHPVRPLLRFESNESAVDERKLHSLRQQMAIRVFEAPPIVHVQVDVDKLGHKCSEDVEHSPLLSIYLSKVELANNMVNIVKFIKRKVLESRKLPSLAVDLNEHMFVRQVGRLQHVLNRVECPSSSFGDCSHADVVEMLVVGV